MCTPWTMTRLARWRIRDLATCFFPCRFPLGVVSDEEPDICCSSSPQMRSGPIVSSPMGDNRSHETNRYNQERELVQGSTQCTGSGAKKATDDSCWPKFTDEDYIVFCFKEDGVIHVVNDGKSESSDHLNRPNRSPRPANRKLMYGEIEEEVCHSGHEDMLDEDVNYIYPTNEGDTIICNTKGKEKGIIYLDTELPSEGMREEIYVEEKKECKTVSAESSNSTQSDSSTSSFAFPVLRWEWMGSPAQMPKSECQHFRKHKHRSVRLQCCRF